MQQENPHNLVRRTAENLDALHLSSGPHFATAALKTEVLKKLPLVRSMTCQVISIHIMDTIVYTLTC